MGSLKARSPYPEAILLETLAIPGMLLAPIHARVPWTIHILAIQAGVAEVMGAEVDRVMGEVMGPTGPNRNGEVVCGPTTRL